MKLVTSLPTTWSRLLKHGALDGRWTALLLRSKTSWTVRTKLVESVWSSNSTCFSLKLWRENYSLRTTTNSSVNYKTVSNVLARSTVFHNTSKALRQCHLPKLTWTCYLTTTADQASKVQSEMTIPFLRHNKNPWQQSLPSLLPDLKLKLTVLWSSINTTTICHLGNLIRLPLLIHLHPWRTWTLPNLKNFLVSPLLTLTLLRLTEWVVLKRQITSF